MPTETRPFVTRMVWEGETDGPTWSVVRDVVLTMPSIPGSTPGKVLCLYGPDGAQLMTEHAEGYGFFISVFEAEEIVEWVAVEESLGPENVLTGGDLDAMPRMTLVSEQAAMTAIRHFFQFGTRAPETAWIRSVELYR